MTAILAMSGAFGIERDLASRDLRPLARPRPQDVGEGGESASLAASLPRIDAPVSPSFAEQVGFLTALHPDGSLNTDPDESYWEHEGVTAHKWDTPTAGTGATVTYFFNPGSTFTANEELTFRKAFGLWEAVCDIDFVEAGSANSADILIFRGSDESAYFEFSMTNGGGDTLGQYAGQTRISIDNSVTGYELTGSFDTVGGFGLSVVVHEVGHALGLGHAGYYNGEVDPATEQFSQYDEGQWSVMSYLYWGDTDAKFYDSYLVSGTNWGVTNDGYHRAAPHSWMPVDIVAAQQLYGPPDSTPLNGGDTFGFNGTVSGPIASFFDFTINRNPVITLFSTGVGNTLDASGFTANARIDLRPLGFSSLNGMTNNIAIAQGTIIEIAIGGAGRDTIDGGDVRNTLSGKGGVDTLRGNGGDDFLIGGNEGDSLSGGVGLDTAGYRAAPAGVVVDFKATARNTGDAAGDRYSSIENLNGSGHGDLLCGDDLANRIDGIDGADYLRARKGDDTIIGGSGQDTIKAARGADQIRLTEIDVTLSDRILDFSKDDVLALDGAVFGLAPGALDPAIFVAGAQARDAGDRLIYKANGKLYFDPDGTGSAAQVQIAILLNTPVLTASDVTVI